MMKTAIIALTGVLACSAAKAVRTATPAEMPVTTNRIVVADRGIVADGKTDQSAAIQRLVDGAPDGTEFVFPAGDCFVARSVKVKERRHLLFRGAAGTRLVLHFSPWGETSEDNTAFSCVRSERLATVSSIAATAACSSRPPTG